MDWCPDQDALRGKVAVVAGATRGGGRGIAAALGSLVNPLAALLPFFTTGVMLITTGYLTVMVEWYSVVVTSCSLPLMPSLAVKKSVPFTLVKDSGDELMVAIAISLTKTVPLLVPSLFQIS